VDFDEFTEATAVVVSHCLGVAERFQQGVGCRRNYECQSMLWPLNKYVPSHLLGNN